MGFSDVHETHVEFFYTNLECEVASRYGLIQG